ncbi:MAG: distal tail protein Dit [Clostridium sp.]|uniref:distal tail protein Dit n=1 Tax=Clostridium sp. TaxID=1506 RepID=UPI0039ED2AF8
MAILGVTFNNKNSYTDFNLYIEEKHINPPVPKIIKDSVPYQNGQYDLSMVGSNGHVVYDTRTIIIKFLLANDTMEDLYELYSSVIEWLLNVGQSQLIFDFMPDYYFLVRVQDVPTFDEFVDNGDLQVTFICDPFKYVRNNQVIAMATPMTIYNPYIYSSPNIRIYSNGIGNFILNGKTYAINTTTYVDLNYLYLESGQNTISFNGNISKVEITPNFRRL